MSKKIYQIGDYRGRLNLAARNQNERCYCEALRCRQEFFTAELRESQVPRRWPNILRLESLEAGIPETPAPSSQGWDLIYSSELLTSLPTIAARQVVRIAASKLNPGGRLLLANVSLNTHVRQCCQCHGHGQTFRSELEMAELTRDLPDVLQTGQAIFRDYPGLNVYLELHKSTELRAA
ncbi:MAG TPA: hypothetical protein VHZ55_08720 [Bryobacteraceae bacterium]|nr:hypothetical protein [Bryobacteraceae bacterium]